MSFYAQGLPLQWFPDEDELNFIEFEVKGKYDRMCLKLKLVLKDGIWKSSSKKKVGIPLSYLCQSKKSKEQSEFMQVSQDIDGLSVHHAE